MRRAFANQSLTYRMRIHHGAVLFFVMGIILLMSILVTLFLELSIKKMREQAVTYVADDLRGPAYSALEVTLGVLNVFREYDGSLTGPAQGWSNPIAYSEIPFAPELSLNVTIADETGKFPLLKDDRQMMLDVFTAMGFDLSDADILFDSLQDWIDEDDMTRINGAEDDFYERETPSYKAANRPINSFSELRYLRGFKELCFDEDGNPNEKYRLLQKATSLHNKTSVNINTAPPEVWAVYSEMDGVDVSGISDDIKGADGILGTPDDKPINASQLQNVKYTTSEMEVFKVIVDVSRADSHFILHALIEAKAGGSTNPPSGNSTSTYPFKILQLAENQPIE